MNTGFEKIDKPVVRPLGREKICSCGVKFISYSNRRYSCNPKCNTPKFTDYDKKVMSDFRAMCKRYGLRQTQTLQQITGKHGMCVWRLRTAKDMSKPYKDRMIMIVRRFTEDLRAGLYDLVIVPEIWALQYKVEFARRMTPLPRTCPRHLSSCAGAFYKGDCPRNWKACELSEKHYGKREASRSLELLVSNVRRNLGFDRAPSSE